MKKAVCDNKSLMFLVSIYHTSSSVLLWELGPGWCHLWDSFISKTKMRFFLVIFDSICGKNWMSFIRIISKFTFSGAFKISWICSKLIMSANLIKSILQMESLVKFKVPLIFFLFERFQLFGLEILTPASGMIPVAWF